MGLRWYLFGLGVVLSLILRMVNVPALAFALGMYLPIELNTPLLLGGFLSWLVSRKRAGEGDEVVKPRQDRGILIASGLMAGGAIMGVVDAIVNAVIKMTTGAMTAKDAVHLLPTSAFEGPLGEVLAIIGLEALCVFIVVYSKRARPVRAA
jgi:uncharacterized oligopeptide transporter (OPT) family protein